MASELILCIEEVWRGFSLDVLVQQSFLLVSMTKSNEKSSQESLVKILSPVSEPVEVGFFPDVEKGEVLVDSRGEGSFQCR